MSGRSERAWRRSVWRFLKYHGMPYPSGRLGFTAFRELPIDWERPERYHVVRAQQRRTGSGDPG